MGIGSVDYSNVGRASSISKPQNLLSRGLKKILDIGLAALNILCRVFHFLTFNIFNSELKNRAQVGAVSSSETNSPPTTKERPRLPKKVAEIKSKIEKLNAMDLMGYVNSLPDWQKVALFRHIVKTAREEGVSLPVNSNSETIGEELVRSNNEVAVKLINEWKDIDLKKEEAALESVSESESEEEMDSSNQEEATGEALSTGKFTSENPFAALFDSNS